MQAHPNSVNDLDSLSTQILSMLESVHTESRKLIAIAGPPASGKSTLLSALVPLLQAKLKASNVIGIPMDGFHLDNAQLDHNGLRAVKGAPHTFDVHGLLSLVQRLHANEHLVYAPEFDRASDLSRNCAIKIESTHNVVVIEGNYLLLDQPVWRELARHFAVTINIDVPNSLLQDRLIQRWLHYGLSKDEALNKAQSNDIPNAKTVVEQSIAADIIFQPENNT